MSSPRPPEVDILALAQIDTATVSNAMDSLVKAGEVSEYGFSSLELRCQLPDLPPMVGFAVTCIRDYSIGGGPARTGNDRQLFEAIRDSPKPLVVVCQFVGPDRLMSNQFGDVMASTFQRLGAVGAVTDGGFRDLAGIKQRAPGFQVFAAGAVAAAGISVIGDVGVAVKVAGLSVSPGDLLHGDANGIVRIPHSVAHLVPDRSRDVLAREDARVSFVQSEEFTFDELARRSGW